VRAGREIRLTDRELELAAIPAEHHGQIVSRERSVEAVWEHDFETFSTSSRSTFATCAPKDRRAVTDPPDPHVRGAGYVLREDAREALTLRAAVGALVRGQWRDVVIFSGTVVAC